MDKYNEIYNQALNEAVEAFVEFVKAYDRYKKFYHTKESLLLVIAGQWCDYHEKLHFLRGIERMRADIEKGLLK